ncbi:hypothetical protein BGX30_008258, partial [Mortierella sp. GBA39]
MGSTVHDDIRQRFMWSQTTLGSEIVDICATLSEQLANGADPDVDVKTKELRSVRLLYQMLALKLVPEYHAFERGLEDTFCHAALDAFFTIFFPKKGVYNLDWANKETEGSKERRAHGYKPDAIISKKWKRIGVFGGEASKGRTLRAVLSGGFVE